MSASFNPRARFRRMNPSIGVRSGLYGGSAIRIAPVPSTARRASAAWCGFRLSQITTSPGRSCGANACAT